MRPPSGAVRMRLGDGGVKGLGARMGTMKGSSLNTCFASRLPGWFRHAAYSRGDRSGVVDHFPNPGDGRSPPFAADIWTDLRRKDMDQPSSPMR